MFRSALLVAALLTAIASAADKSPDSHFLAGSTAAIAHKSVFVHGYLHGYEEGFHLADLDIQLARGARDVNKVKKEEKDGDGYRREFGDKQFFERGYREGLRVGYADGMAGRAFRAIAELQAIGAIVPETAHAAADPGFDQAFSEGYANGQRQGIQDGRNDVGATSRPPACPDESGGQGFCIAYFGGYRVGYADGFTNVARRATARLEARAGK